MHLSIFLSYFLSLEPVEQWALHEEQLPLQVSPSPLSLCLDETHRNNTTTTNSTTAPSIILIIPDISNLHFFYNISIISFLKYYFINFSYYYLNISFQILFYKILSLFLKSCLAYLISKRQKHILNKCSAVLIKSGILTYNLPCAS